MCNKYNPNSHYKRERERERGNPFYDQKKSIHLTIICKDLLILIISQKKKKERKQDIHFISSIELGQQNKKIDSFFF